MRKYFVSVPILVRAEITVYAENEEDAKEKAMLTADIEHINRETIEAIDYEEDKDELYKEIDDFLKGSFVLDYEEEFGFTD